MSYLSRAGRGGVLGVGLLAVAGACAPRGPVAGGGSPPLGGTSPDGGGGTPVDVGLPPELTGSAAEVRAALVAEQPADADAFLARWPTRFLTGLPYDPLAAENLDLIATSTLGLSDGERALLARDGFAISARQTFPTFFYGYKTLYADHLPLFVSADSVLHAIHRSYDKALMTVERAYIIATLGDLLAGMHAALGAGAGADLPPEVRADVDLYLTVARQLLTPASPPTTPPGPVAGADPGVVQSLVAAAKDATQAAAEVNLFGGARLVDFTQFKPRGHYAGDYQLEPYFRSMMWLGRTDLRLLTYDTNAAPTAPPSFDRRQFLDSLLLAELAAGARLDQWTSIDAILRGFVGESDNLTLPDFGKLTAALGASSLTDIDGDSDEQIAGALLDGGLGIQRIASQVLLVPPGGAGVPLDRVFLFFGQRFVIDAQVFSDVVFDRVRPKSGEPERMLPNPLDAAFAALGNNTAAPLLETELRTYPSYVGALHDARRLVDAHGDDFWGESLYTVWLSALRGLSAPGGDPTAIAGLPTVMQTEAWGRRLVSTQLASWAELRHDTLLYAKQSYTAVPSCEFPDAYVDPYPGAWAAMARLGMLGQNIAAALPASLGATAAQLATYFGAVASIATTLQGMAASELTGTPFSADQMAFINQTVDEILKPAGCTQTRVPQGWYAQLFLDQSDAQTTDPTIADVHTDPADLRILHVGTGLPRYMVVTADTCTGPRAYAGLASSYYEVTTANNLRLDDMQWSTMLNQAPAPADVSWAADLVAR